MSLLCLCLTAPTVQGAVNQLNRYRDYTDMAEARVDLLDSDQRDEARHLPERCGIPMILTARFRSDGGNWSEDDSVAREDYLVRLLEHGGWAWVDLEHGRSMPKVEAAALAAGTRIIRSHHDFSGDLLDRPVPELAGLIRNMTDSGALPKLAVHCSSSRQLLSLARLGVAVSDITKKVLLGMGEFGGPSRILADRLGSAWTYSSAIGGPDDPPAAAPGQFDPQTLEELYRFRAITEKSALFAVTGNPIAHSRSPLIHNEWLQKAEIDGTYISMRSDDAAALLETCDLWGIRGLSVTVPHKTKALSLCDYSGHLARKIGAANTLIRAGDGWRARNTDSYGFLRPLPAALGLKCPEDLKGLKALVIGAGGAARAAVHSLADLGVELVLLNRTEEKARHLALEIDALAGGLDESSRPMLDNVDFAVQTSAAGMHPLEDVNPLPWWDFAGCRLAYDMVYEPNKTLFLKSAEAAGIQIMNGASMLENQARMQFKLFTGVDSPETK